MGTTSQKIQYLGETKDLLKDSINSLGGNITSQTTFRQYATELDSIYSSLPKVSGTGSVLSLSPTLKGRLGSVLKGDTLQQQILPDNYTQVDYIQSSGTQYINTGVTNNGYKSETIITWTNLSKERQIMGSQNVGFFGLNNGKYEIYQISNYSAEENRWDKVIFQVEKDSTNSYRSLTVNDNVLFNRQSSTTMPSNPIYIFAIGTTGIYLNMLCECKIKNQKIWNENNILVRDFIPCYRNSDNEVGMYDLVNNVFYTNQGTGAFTYGAVVPTPDGPLDIQCVEGIQNITICGKNLFDKDSVITGKYYSATGTLTNFTNGYGELLTVNENEVYSLKITNNYSSTVRLQVFVYDNNMNRLAQIKWGDNLTSGSSYINQNYTMPNGAKYIGISVLDMQPTTENINKIPIQLEVGTSATEYEPYQGQKYDINLDTIELNKIGDYQDYISGTPNNWVINRQIGKVVLDGNISFDKQNTWSDLGNNTNAFYKGYLAFENMKTNEIVKSNNFNYNSNLVNTDDYGIYLTTNLIIRVPKTITTSTELNTWFGENKPIVYYPLNTATTETITNTELINQLNTLYNAKSYDGTTNIIVDGDLAAILNVSVLKGE